MSDISLRSSDNSITVNNTETSYTLANNQNVISVLPKNTSSLSLTAQANTITLGTNPTAINVTRAGVGERGLTGATGAQGETGTFEDTFELVSKNLKSWAVTFNYTGDQLTSISYTNGMDTILKTLNYTGDKLTSLVLSGDTPSGISLTKTLSYTGDKLTGASYS